MDYFILTASKKVERIKFHGASFLFQIATQSPILLCFFLQLTWPPFGRLFEIQVSTHPQFLPENQALPNETTPVQNRRFVWEELALKWFWALHNYLYVKIKIMETKKIFFWFQILYN